MILYNVMELKKYIFDVHILIGVVWSNIMVKSKVVQKHRVPEGHGSVHALFVVLQTEVKVYV